MGPEQQILSQALQQLVRAHGGRDIDTAQAVAAVRRSELVVKVSGATDSTFFAFGGDATATAEVLRAALKDAKGSGPAEVIVCRDVADVSPLHAQPFLDPGIWTSIDPRTGEVTTMTIGRSLD